MAAIKPANLVLQALTSAALLLPGLSDANNLVGSDSTASFQYSHYQEGKRDLYNQPNNRDPIEVDTFHFNSSVSLTDRIQFSFAFTQDTWSGATPVATSPLAANSNNPIYSGDRDALIQTGASPLLNRTVLLNQNGVPVQRDVLTGVILGEEKQSVHILSSASPETRQQGDFGLGYEWDEAQIAITGGLSTERDYDSAYGGIQGRMDFNQKLTTLKFGVNYTHSDTHAIIDHDASPYITKTAYRDQIKLVQGSEILYGTKQDWGVNLGLSQILTKNALLDINLGFTHSTGFMENPYKATTVIFLGPEPLFSSPDALILGDVRALLEQRPDERNQFSFSTRYAQHISALDASLHLSYQFSHDDWSINAHTFEAEWIQSLGHGWTVSPRIRYYSQSEANFYTPYLTSQQSFRSIARDAQGREIWVDANAPDNGVEYYRDDSFNLIDANGHIVDETFLNVIGKTVAFDPDRLPNDFSSDHRLSGYGALSGGITLIKQFAKGFSLEMGFEYYTHAGDLKLGESGEDAYADFDFFSANAALSVDLDLLNTQPSLSLTHHAGHSHDKHIGHSAPAGLMFSHMINQQDGLMIGYRFKHGRRSGETLNGSDSVNDLSVVRSACDPAIPCRYIQSYMEMDMHMVNLMYAPIEGLNLMLMPQWMSMDMNLRELQGRPDPVEGEHEHSGIAGHETGGVGDTIFAALLKLWTHPNHELHLGLGFSAPTGDVEQEFRRIARQDGGIVHFGMQLGSGTWDFLPSLTYNGQYQDWFWGAQVQANLRMEHRNKSGYRLGDQLQTSLWGGYQLTDWLSATLRSQYSVEGSIKGDFNTDNARIGPMDFPANYGGRFWDIGLGVQASLPDHFLKGHTFRFEWLQPVHDDMNGYQIERDHTLIASWSYNF